jgi:hypothetical protein
LVSGKSDSHKHPTPERLHIGGVELEPFGIGSFCVESAAPIGFDATRMIRFDHVDGRGFLWQLDRELILPTANGPL